MDFEGMPHGRAAMNTFWKAVGILALWGGAYLLMAMNGGAW